MGCLMLVDQHSKWVAPCPIRIKMGETMTKVIHRNIFPGLPMLPDQVLSDNGPEFAASGFNDSIVEMGNKRLFRQPTNHSLIGALSA